MNNNINDPNSPWHKREVILCDDLEYLTSKVLVTRENGKVIIRDNAGEDITENAILTYDDGRVVKAVDII